MLKLRELREKKGLSQRDMAKVMNITQASYWSLEKEKSLLNSKQIILLSDFFGVTPNDLLGIQGIHKITISSLEE